jgi:2-keto-3-deoxy-L-rhamnonate aldolase RhmA
MDFPMGIYTNDAASAKQALDQGFTLIAVGADVTLLAGAIHRIIGELR